LGKAVVDKACVVCKYLIKLRNTQLLDFFGLHMVIEAILIDADGVVQYAPEDWPVGFARALDFENVDQVMSLRPMCLLLRPRACLRPVVLMKRLSKAGGFDEALDEVLRTWGRTHRKSSVLDTMLTIKPYEQILNVINTIRASGIKCYVASNPQTLRAEFVYVRR
jgi:beta-phosphoglucomutase-like phosphatase (HAD superfamily)